MIPNDTVEFADEGKRKALRAFLQAAHQVRFYIQQAKDYAVTDVKMTTMRLNSSAQAFVTLRSMIEPFSPKTMPDLAAYAQAQLPDYITDYANDHAQILAEADAAAASINKQLDALGIKDRPLAAQEMVVLRADLDRPVVAAEAALGIALPEPP